MQEAQTTTGVEETTPTTAATPKKETEEELLERLLSHCNLATVSSSSTDSIGHRNVRPHRRIQSSSLFTALDPPRTRHRLRALSLAEQLDIAKFYPGSHLVEKYDGGGLYCSLWLVPPAPLLKPLSKEITKLSMKYAVTCGSSAPFVPHVTVIGSIRCETQREVNELGKKLRKGLRYSGIVPCRFDKNQPCQALYNNEQKLVWSQSCISRMERTDEFMQLLAASRTILKFPAGEWMFPGPACDPHYSKFYGRKPIPEPVPPPPDFDADEAVLFLTTPGTLVGVAQWREVVRIPLRPPSQVLP